MKGVLENIQHYCIHDGPGIRTVVFLKGCPLRCRWCSNPTTQEHKPELLYHADKCFSCGHCAEICPQRAVSREDEAVLFDRAGCARRDAPARRSRSQGSNATRRTCSKISKRTWRFTAIPAAA